MLCPSAVECWVLLEKEALSIRVFLVASAYPLGEPCENLELLLEPYLSLNGFTQPSPPRDDF